MRHRIAGLVFASALLAASASTGGEPQRVLVLGFDGMDPKVCRELMAANKLPFIQQLAKSGTFTSLATSNPPQSPVAWSNVISGAGAGVHQIFDFIHRDPRPDNPKLPLHPFLSISEILPPEKTRAIDIGKWSIPLTRGKPVSLRRGSAFWDHLVINGVDTAIYRMPANYPPPEVAGSGHFSSLCGMGTPDLLGTYGEFTLYTPDAPLRSRAVPGGKFVGLFMLDHRATALLTGPANFLKPESPNSKAPSLSIAFEVVRDPQADVAKITIGDHLEILNAGEWTRWLPIAFETGVPGAAVLGALQAPVSVPAMVRFYLKSVHPKLELYASPLNIDPLRAATPISTPKSFAGNLAKATGRYFTTGIPEDAKAIRAAALDEDEFLKQVNLVLEERIAQYRYALQNFDDGLLFFYFGTPDLLSHIFWRDRDPGHPGRDPEQGDRYAGVIDDCYVRMDALIGEALGEMHDSDTLIVLSDHGFTSFRRAVHLNTWLRDNGYLAIEAGRTTSEAPMFQNVDWSKTRAYAFGINGLFVNQLGREARGIVAPGDDTEKLLQEISEKLQLLQDDDGSPAIEKIYRVSDVHPGADADLAPDVIVGYADFYRGSWTTALGGIADKVFEDNLDRWSGDHCVAPHLVPGILACNRKVDIDDPRLADVTATILSLFDIEADTQMNGRNLITEP